MKKILSFALILCILMSVCVFSGCERTPTEAESAEILSEFKRLYQLSVELNDYIFGSGLPVSGDVDPGTVTSPYYVAISDDSPYKTVDELKNAVLSVYSPSYYEDSIDSMLFNGYGEDSNVSPRYIVEKGVLKSDIGFKGFDTTGRFDPSTAKIVKLTAGFCQIEADYVRGTVSGRYTLTLAKTSSGWRFDAPSY